VTARLPNAVVAAGLAASALVVPLAALDAQALRDSGRVQLVELRLGPEDADTVALRRGIVYWAEVVGSGTPLLVPVEPRDRGALVVPLADGANGSRRFEVYAMADGRHVLRLSDVPAGTRTTVKLYQDVAATRRVAERHDREFAFGVLVGAGVHTGYRIDPRDSASPSGGGDLEGCLLLEVGDRFSACLGAGRQSFPAMGSTFGWFFMEARGVIARTRALGDRRLELGATLRYAQGPFVGTPEVYPGLLAVGVFVRQHLAPLERRRGLSVFGAWQHSRVISVPGIDGRNAERLTAGLTWVP
jgi:hypothetical protein